LSEIRATTISDETGNGPIALTKQSAAKCYARWTVSSSTPTLRESINVSTISDDSAGHFRVNFTNSFTSTYYQEVGSAGGNSGSNGDEAFIAFSSSTGGTVSQSHQLRNRRGSGNVAGSHDPIFNTYLAHGDLA
tara:strand:- start:1361 stop:1762 length:402 start_codon:yes stop_codon:yes gene_type:complete